MIRDIVEIDEEKCDGCGLCIPSCAEGALYLESGQARLRSDALCDGLGACLGGCPRGALRVTKREAVRFDEAAAHAAAAHSPPPAHPDDVSGRGCPGSRPRLLQPAEAAPAGRRPAFAVLAEAPPPLVPQGGSRLGQWPVQLHLVSPGAPYLRGSDILLAADCVPFAYARFHEELLAGRRVLVGCPKLDDLAAYAEKLTQIFRAAAPRSVTVAKMEVPCCSAIAVVARQALAAAGVSAPFEVVTVGIAGGIVGRE
jgi:Pyruvate/2-oxoacid:ferredoxin oxidoreductase delta subunit